MNTVSSFESQVEAVESVKIKIFKDSGRDARSNANLNIIYPFQKACWKNKNVKWFLNERVNPCLPSGFYAAVVDGDGEVVHGRTLMANL